MDTTELPSALMRVWRSTRLSWLIVSIALFLPFTVAAQTYEILHNFGPLPPAFSYSALIQDPSGNFYGTSTQGGSGAGSGGLGTIFELQTDGTLKILHSFQGTDGAVPYAAVIRDDSGNLYGTTSAGGGPDGNYYGTVFELDPSGTLSTLHAFSPFEQGANLRGSLIRDAAGNLYGTAAYGGANHYGIVFKIDPSGAMTTLHTFGYVDGSYPMAGLIEDAAGNLYGTTSGIGQNIIHGTIFRMDPAGTLTTLHFFNRPDGAYPLSALIRDNSGNLYGTTSEGGSSDFGTIFRLDGAGVLTTLHAFNGSDGANPKAALVRDDIGNIYGTTANGGAYGFGTVFQLDHLGNLTTLHSFKGSDGANPSAPLIRDASGNLVGTTASGGAAARGTIFRIDPSGTLTTLHNFSSPEPAFPRSGLALDGSGNLYGTSFQGGWNDLGTVFKLDGLGALTTLHSFNGLDGAHPWASVLLGAFGSLYGTTRDGGTLDVGTIFQLDASGTLTTLHSFGSSGGIEGSNPYAALIQDEWGNLYGTTAFGGSSGGGTIFMYNPPGLLTTLCSLSGNPETALVRDASGNLYGTTPTGDYNYGDVFRLDASNTLTILHHFLISDGAHPLSPLVRDPSGNLYGTTSAGGDSGLGTVYRLGPSGTLTTLHSFDGSDGEAPSGSLVRDGSGNLYGTTAGTIFKLDAAGIVTTLHRFGDPPYGPLDGALPTGLIQDAIGNLYGTTSRGGSGGTGVIFRVVFDLVRDVTIDIKPGSDSNPINPGSKGKIPVAILGTETFDVATVNAALVRFGVHGAQAAPAMFAVEDVNDDGRPDLLLHFNTQETGIQCGDTSVPLTGVTFDGRAIQGSDRIQTVGCK
jgi:uncharacterized repeat protein (TIGR03803 family)